MLWKCKILHRFSFDEEIKNLNLFLKIKGNYGDRSERRNESISSFVTVAYTCIFSDSDSEKAQMVRRLLSVLGLKRSWVGISVREKILMAKRSMVHTVTKD